MLPILKQLGPNFVNVECDGVIVWFSYETPIAFSVNGYLYARKNEWSVSTGKHLNTLEPDKLRRLDSEAFQAAWDKHVTNRPVPIV